MAWLLAATLDALLWRHSVGTASSAALDVHRSKELLAERPLHPSLLQTPPHTRFKHRVAAFKKMLRLLCPIAHQSTGSCAHTRCPATASKQSKK